MMVLTPSELTQCLRPLSEMVQGGLQQLFIVELVMMAMQAERKVEQVVSQ